MVAQKGVFLHCPCDAQNMHGHLLHSEMPRVSEAYALLLGPSLHMGACALLLAYCCGERRWARAQTGESWNKVVQPKALGAWNLDAATRGLASLEHFVCFSSIVATLGNAGALGPGFNPHQPTPHMAP